MVKDYQNESIVERVIREFEGLAAGRYNFESQWREIAERFYPQGTQTFNPSETTGSLSSQGDKRSDKVLDSTQVMALNRFGAIMDSMLTPANQKWHRLATNNPVLDRNRQVQVYFDEVSRILFKYRYQPRANFVGQNQKVWKSLGAYGNGPLFVDEMTREKGIRYKSIHLGEVYLDVNHQGVVDKFIRSFPMSCRQAYQKWGENLPEAIKNCKDPNRQFRFLHYVAPRTDDYDPSVLTAKGKPFASYYISMEGRVLLSEGGFTSFPLPTARYEQADDEIYARSPAMDAMPAVKTLQEQKRTLLKQGHKAVDPTLLVADDGIISSLRPGAVNSGGVSKDGRLLVHALPVGNVQIGKEMMELEKASINDSFLVSLFQILVETPTRTATEVLEIAKEKGILLFPSLGRQHSEYLGPMIDRELDILASQGLLPPMPGILKEARGDYDVVYDSPLTRAAQSEEAAGLMRTLEMALNAANVTQDPSILDNFNLNEAIPDIARIQGVPARWLNDEKTKAAMREQRQQQKNIETAVQAGPSVAAVMKAGQQ
jgi:hypothetical protein